MSHAAVSFPAPATLLHYLFRMSFGATMATYPGRGATAVRRDDHAAHRAWMIRAYALAAGAGTQVFTQAIQESVFGEGAVSSGLALGAPLGHQPSGGRVRHRPWRRKLEHSAAPSSRL